MISICESIFYIVQKSFTQEILKILWFQQYMHNNDISWYNSMDGENLARHYP